MNITEKDKKHIMAMLTANYQIARMKLASDKKILQEIKNNTCTDQQWQELYFRFLREK